LQDSGSTWKEINMNKNPKENRGMKKLLKHYKKIFRIPENLDYYSRRDYEIAEKKFLKYALRKRNVRQEFQS
jgi:hypothetical protein